MGKNISRRRFIGTALTGAAVVSAQAATGDPQPGASTPEDGSVPIKDYPITHGWVRPFRHPQLGVDVHGQSAVRYLRFLQPVRLDYLELKPLVYGRWVPSVPTHPAHVTLAVLQPGTHKWKTVRSIELPPDPVTAGQGFSQSMTIEEMESRLSCGLQKAHQLELGGITAEVLRVECDREHQYWPNHGECNGGPFNVPFGILNTLQAFGARPEGEPVPPDYLPPLRVEGLRPEGTAGLRAELRPGIVYFESPRLSVGFSLRRPLIMHLGWDGTGGNRAGENRLMHSQPHSGGESGASFLSGPMLRTFRANHGPHQWTGSVSVEGNCVRYRGLSCGEGVEIDALFTVQPDRFVLDLTQTCDQELPLLEAEAWRLNWNVRAAMTAAAAVPTMLPGRNGNVEVPMFWAGDGNGCLRCALLEGQASMSHLQVESYRSSSCLTGGLLLAPRPAVDKCLCLPAGSLTTRWEWSVTNFEPTTSAGPEARGEAVRRHWASVYSCFRAEYRGFSNNAVSVNCHVNQHSPAELVAFTAKPESGPDPIRLYRYTVGRALMDGGGYGYWRNLYLDSDPILLSAAGRIHQARPDLAWLRSVQPGLEETIRRVLATIGAEGLAVCRDLSGNTGSFRWSSNAMDLVGFGHIDGYVNAWTYRGLRNAAALMEALGQTPEAHQCRCAAAGLREAYPRFLLNPETGWVAGWRSRDGRLHDAAYLWVNGLAAAFGLLPEAAAKEALKRLEDLRGEVRAASAHFGLPFNLRPIAPGDHMLPRIFGPLSPTFEHYTDGAMSTTFVAYYLRALQLCGLRDQSAAIVRDLEEGYARGHFNGGVGSGVEFYRWDGAATGYEGTFVASYGALYAIAVERGLICPHEPEWWPADGLRSG